MRAMLKLLRITTFAAFLFASFSAAAQVNMGGTWKGVLKDSLGAFDYSLRITKIVNGEVSGTGLSGNQTLFCETNIKGSLKNGHLIIYEAEIIRTNYKNKETVCLLGFDLTLNNKILSGTFRPVTNEASCLPGTAALQYEVLPDALAKVSVTTTITTAKKPAPTYQDRKLSLIKEIIIDADAAEIQLFDNGVVDGDSITLTDNNQEVFTKALLSTTPLKYSFNNKETNTHTIAFVADNLGSIPPNTGLMVVTANRQRWEIFFSSDFQKTSYVKIVLKEGKK
jgi:hypothetical protein